MSKETGGPAFPQFGYVNSGGCNLDSSDAGGAGLTLRDHFAAKAMQGYLSNSWQAEQLESMGESVAIQIATIADISYVMADAMLEARKE